MSQAVPTTVLCILCSFAACTFDPLFSPDYLRCTDSNGCPAGYRCVVADGDGRTAGVCCNALDATECRTRAIGDAASPNVDAKVGPPTDVSGGSGGSGGAGGTPAEDAPIGDATTGSAGGAGGVTGTGGTGTGGARGTGGAIPANIAENKTATASSNNGDATKGNDGDPNTAFCGESVPVTWTVDLGATFQVSSIIVRFKEPTSLYTYCTEFSVDEVTWTPCSERTLQAGLGIPEGFSKREAHYLRLSIARVSPPGAACLSEFVALGSPAPEGGGR